MVSVFQNHLGSIPTYKMYILSKVNEANAACTSGYNKLLHSLFVIRKDMRLFAPAKWVTLK